MHALLALLLASTATGTEPEATDQAWLESDARRLVKARWTSGADVQYFELFHEDGSAASLPVGLQRTNNLVKYSFMDQHGAVLTQEQGWSRMDDALGWEEHQRDIRKKMLGPRIVEAMLLLPGIGLAGYAVISSGEAQQSPARHPALWAGGTLVLLDFAFAASVRAPMMRRLRAGVGREGLYKAQDHYSR